MRQAVLLAYFTRDSLLVEFYNLLACELEEKGFAVTGVDTKVAEPLTYDHYQFPITSFEDRAAIRKLKLRIAPAEKRPADSLLQCYARMQAQCGKGAAYNSWFGILSVFRVRLERYLIENKVCLMVLNHQFSGFHLIARDLCLKFGIAFVFWHPGFLPGTMCFDRRGQLAESEINEEIAERIDWESTSDRSLGLAYRDWVRQGTYLRPAKTSTSNPELMRLIREAKGRFKKLILVIGANDFRSGFRPSCYPNASLHCASFSSSDELFQKVAGMVENDTMVLYKPHPNTSQRLKGACFITPNTCRVFDVTLRDLFPHVDLAVTVCSTGIYEAMLFGVPSIVVGNLPGTSAGICFTADSRNLSKVLQDALQSGMTTVMEEKLLHLVGFLLRTYFFSEGSAGCGLVRRNLKTTLHEYL